MVTMQTRPADPQASKPKRRVTGLDWLIIAGLVATFAVYLMSSLIFLALYLSSGTMAPPFIPTVVATIGVALGIGVALTGWRWSVIVSLIVVLMDLSGLINPYIPHSLTHPSENLPAFATFETVIVSSALILGAIIVKFVRMRGGQPNVLSRGMVGYTGVLAGVLAGVLLLGFTVQPSSSASTGAATPKNETVNLTGTVFAPDIVALHAGDTLTITDTDAIHHILTNGTWSPNNKPVPGVEPGAVIVSNLNIDNGSTKVGPFTQPGTYHIYCTIHPGMSLTIIVQ
jgi:plastocyanin